MDNLLKPPPDSDSTSKHRKLSVPEETHQESAKEDESVGSYYLDQKNWKAALSRFESAVVLDPENPDVYWGLAEAQRHTGDYFNAKANYLKVTEYDPDSRHGKEAKKFLKDPELANAKAVSIAPATQSHP
jgi:Tfp pilus assembly protein PilF